MHARVLGIFSDRESEIISRLCFEGKVHLTRKIREGQSEPAYSDFTLCDGNCDPMLGVPKQELPDGIERAVRKYMAARNLNV